MKYVYAFLENVLAGLGQLRIITNICEIGSKFMPCNYIYLYIYILAAIVNETAILKYMYMYVNARLIHTCTWRFLSCQLHVSMPISRIRVWRIILRSKEKISMPCGSFEVFVRVRSVAPFPIDWPLAAKVYRSCQAPRSACFNNQRS